jgi:hypothetical protein
MDQIAATIFLYMIALSYPTVSGPIAAYAFVLALKRDDSRLILAFWSLLLVVHFAGFFLFIGNPGGLITQGFISCLVTPVFAASTALGLRIASRRLSEGKWEDTTRRTWLRIGTFLIPLMQVSTMVIAVLFAPVL